MKACPFFECLDYTASTCEQFPACDGCEKNFDCSLCSNQSTLVEGTLISCDLITLSEACRFCAKRTLPEFSSEQDCIGCVSYSKP